MDCEVVLSLLLQGSVHLTTNYSTECPNATFTCSAVNFPSTTIRWFLNEDVIAIYPIYPADEYPLKIMTTPPDVDVYIQEANSRNGLSSFLSFITVNISALRSAMIDFISCGELFLRMSINVSVSPFIKGILLLLLF